MTLLEANLEVLYRFHPQVGRLVQKAAETPEKGVWTPSRAGVPTVRRSGVSLASSFDPAAEAAKAVPVWDDSVDFAVLVGLGAGYLLEAVVDRYDDLPVVVAEADPAWFAEVLRHRDLTLLWANPRVVPLLGPQASVIGDFFRSLSCRTVEILSWRPLAASEGVWHRAVTDQVAGAQAQARVNLATYQRFGSLWHRNLAKNEAHATQWRPLSALGGWGAGVPAVVAAAGPSLADSLDWMGTFRDRYLLIAVDTAWPALAARGLEPDVLVILDGQYWNSRHVDRPLPTRALVVTEWIGPPRAFRLAPGRTFVASSSVPLFRPREERLWGPLGALPTGGSVATAAWSLALLLGCREVAFAGLDLGYPRGLTHVPGSQFEEALHRRAGRLGPAETLGLGLRGMSGLVWRPALDGGKILSDMRMDLFRDWLSASVASHPEVRVVNLGTRGSVIPGLVSAPVDYGEDWSVIPQRPLPPGPGLVRLNGGVWSPPFAALTQEDVLADFPHFVETAWAAAREFWGASVWDAWAGRAKKTWDLWPSNRSRRAVEEVLTLVLEAEAFWTLD